MAGVCPDELGFIASICTSPDDDAPRLTFADWLEEHGQPERAELIRIQIAWARAKATGADPSQYPLFEDWLERERDLIERRWESWYPGGVKVFIPPAPVLPPNYPESLIGTVARGFMEKVEGPAADWLAHHAALAWWPTQERPCPATAQPIRVVRLTTLPDVHVSFGPFDPRPERGETRPTCVANLQTRRTERCPIAGKPTSVPHDERLAADALCKHVWPWLTIELPPEPSQATYPRREAYYRGSPPLPSARR